ncbi:MAG: PD-(D/E)XK nuclease-like domain-containing protein [Paludibacteraceae bacterium]|nr:PD-(D/E)XK nuclease-like domain-containing protein [Paludibacteraceae bacterium]
MSELTEQNYYTTEMDLKYCSASQWKDFCGCPAIPGCEARTMAKLNGEYEPEVTTALLVGSILDALWENDDPEYIAERFPDCISSRGTTKGRLKTEYNVALQMYQRTLKEPKFCQYMSGDKQTIMTGTIEGLPFKIKIDSFIEGKAIVDLKTTRTLDRDFRIFIPDSGEKLTWFRAYGYDIQLGIYREIVRQNTGDTLRCYLAAVDKEKHPICDVIELPDKMLTEALNLVKRNCKKIIMLKSGEIEPIRCEHSSCDFCRDTHECQVLSADEFETHEIQGA